ncbi:MAG: hypothetical protein GY822_27035 [Deltaproteobacteria bacterium]|nr:hypothetical protein [Deltaproteobacteria bacterium]
MRIFILPLFERLSPLFLALFLSGMYLADSSILQAIPDDECKSFSGVSLGNDPTQSMVMELCRQGDEVRGTRISEGIAGTTIFHLTGVIEDHQVKLYVSAVEMDAPNPGWVTCTDDRFVLVWQPERRALSGIYTSEQCQDVAEIRLVRN